MNEGSSGARPTLPRRIAMRLFPGAVARRDAKRIAQAQLAAMPKLVGERLDDLARALDAISRTVDRQSAEIGLARSANDARFESLANTAAAIDQKATVIDQKATAIGQKLETEVHASGARAQSVDEARRALGEVERQVTAIKEAMLELAGSELVSMNLGHEQIEILRRLDAANLLPTSKR